ncbi:hypothetical protein T492DRAFT_1000565 [Pavlovales sp. CCMP2436]|nr:hypothetical protein T492DRAFT_1000565 [Pavlovales sp. CCMP2436]
MMGDEAPRDQAPRNDAPRTPPPPPRAGEPSTPRTPLECPSPLESPYDGFTLDGEGGGEPAGLGGDGLGGAAAPVDTRRTAEVIAAAPRGNDQVDRGGLAFQALPKGPWATRKLASDVFATLSKGEGHVLNASSTRGASKLRGAESTLICSFGVKARESKAKAKEDGGQQSSNFNHCNDSDNLCKWKIVFEESTTGWVIKSAVLVHCEHLTRSTPRELSAAEREATYSRGQKIPDQLLDLVTNDMKLIQPNVREIHTFIDKKVQPLLPLLSLENTWVSLPKYIYISAASALHARTILPPRPRAAARALHAQTTIRHRWDHQWTRLLAHCRAAPRCAATPALCFRLPHHPPLLPAPHCGVARRSLRRSA